MRAAGIRRYSGPVELLDLPGPGELRPVELLVTARAPLQLEHAAAALTCLRQGTNGQAVVLQPGHGEA